MEKILIIDDEQLYRTMLKHTLTKEGYITLEAESGEMGLELVRTEHPDMVLTDFQMPGIDGLEVLSEIHKLDPKIPVVLFTAFADVALTIRSIQVGAFDFLEKPFNPVQLKITVHNALNSVRLSNSLSEVFVNVSAGENMFEENFPMGKTSQMKEIYKNIGRISLNKINVLIQGETGTGKELIARLIHYFGITRANPFVILNCNTLSESALESELFGQLKETFTGSVHEKKGKLEQAGEGTIYLKDISALSLNTQVKLLRVIQNLEFEKIEGLETIPMKARIIASTSSNLENMVQEGKFREDLYFRLKVFSINLPPLRERKDDIRDLVIYFLHKLNKRLSKNVIKIGDGVLELLQSHDWSGNLKELENTLLQAMVMSKSDVLEKDNISLYKNHRSTVVAEKLPPFRSLSEVEKYHIERILVEVKWNKVEASRILEITRPTLNAKIEKYGLSRN